jgi:hypothetical protein
MGKKKNVKDKNYLDFIPVINESLKWEKEDDGEVIVLQRHTGFFDRIAQKYFNRPEYSHIHMDEFGSFVWLQIDGRKSVYEIGKAVRDEFGEDAEPLYERLSQFINTLEGLKYIKITEEDNNE